MITTAKLLDESGNVLCESHVANGMLRGAVTQAIGRLMHTMTEEDDKDWDKVVIEVNRWEMPK
jgi:hypothetical protein